MPSDADNSVEDMTLEISDEEKRDRTLTDDTLEKAVQIFRDAGFVVLEEVVPEDWLTRTRAEYEEAYWEAWEKELEANPDKVQGKGFQGIPGEFGAQGMPMRMPFMNELAIANPWALQILDVVMGDDFFLALPYGSNTAAPNADPGPQHVHRDTDPHLFPEFPVSTPPTQVVVNIPLTDFTPENGSTELWPGTHRVPDLDPSDGEKLEERAETMPSLRANMPAGSVVVRDMRMWHRGMPNTTDDLRIMLAPYYNHRIHVPPSDPATVAGTIPQSVADEMSERALDLCRHNPVGETP
jgi:ectoine hydroxylase-related dioxygenase (phytanoyl-CoA dioxygenase family)